MSATRTGEPLTAALLAGIALGAIDAFVGLATNPDPGSASYVAGLICGPILLSAVWCTLLGGVVASLRARLSHAPSDATRLAASTVALVWVVSVANDVVRSERSSPEILLVLAAAAWAATSSALLAITGARALATTSPLRRRAAWTGLVLASLAALRVALPSGDLAFRPDEPGCEVLPTTGVVRPNVLLISVDTLRADAARAMRSYRRLAEAGIEFTSYVAPAPWTLPSIASLLTGLSPDEHGAGESLSSRSVIAKTAVRSGIVTLAERLRAAGYRTEAVVTNPFLTPAYGIDRGFCGFRNLSMRSEAVRGLGTTSLVRLLRRVAPGLMPSDRADVVRGAAEAWLAARGPEPFFLWTHFLDPHAPYGDRDGSSTSLTLDLRALHSRRSFETPFSAMALLRSGEYRPDDDERARIVELYRADVAFVDEQIGLLLDFLSARGLLASTVVVLTADHGEELWDHGRVEHGHTLYEEVVHVPLVVSLPGAASPSIDARLATAIDLAPTIAGLAGLSMAAWSGEDLLAPAPSSERSVDLGHLLFGEEWTGVRTATTKYLRSSHDTEEVFDLASDPFERHDRAAAEPTLVAALRALAAPQTRAASAGGGHGEPQRKATAIALTGRATALMR